MDYTLVSDLFARTQADGSRIIVSGWVRNVRDSKAFAFIELNDGTSFRNVQIVLNDTVPDFERIVKTTLGSALTVTGTLKLTPAMQQPFEVQAESVAVNGLSQAEYPLTTQRQ